MTGAKNTKVCDWLYMGDTLKELWEEIDEDVKKGKLDEKKIIRMFVQWAPESDMWICHITVSTYAK
jgi:hypothetical protein